MMQIGRGMRTEKQQAAAAKRFAEKWHGKGYEKGDSQIFWTELLTEVFGIEDPSTFIRFEEQVKVDKTNFIDVHLPQTKVIIEQKSLGKDLRAPIRQSNGSLIIPGATLYHFGVLMSNVHMAWMRAVCGRLKSDYRYSNDIVYNNFPWPTPTDRQREKIEQTAQAILDARALYPDSSLADLYDEAVMPPVLRKAHQQNDRAVMEAYGFPVKNEFTESQCVAELFKLYQELTEKIS